MDKNTQMYVSGLIHRENEKCVCILIEEGENSIEIRMPQKEILSNHGYSAEEIEEILEYLQENYTDIEKTAKSVNPMKAFMN